MAQNIISILIVDNDPSIQTLFKAVLESAGYTVDLASDALEAAALLEMQSFHLALIELKLRGPSGLDLIRRIQDWQPNCAMVMTSINPTRENLLQALRAGVDDFLIKPISTETLCRTVGEALLKHPARRPTSPDITIGALRIESKHRMVYWHEQPLMLTPTEYCALLTLAQHVGQIVPASILIHRCRGYSIGEEDARQLLKPHIANLRHKLEQGGRFKRILLNHRGRGFILNVEGAADGAVCNEEPPDWL
ncbi:MAG: response regulator transcription factor [Aggregatilineales bacterium]